MNINTEFYGTGTVGERGQIVIPSEARNKLNIQPGDKFIFAGHGSILHLIKSSELDRILDKLHRRFEAALSGAKNIQNN